MSASTAWLRCSIALASLISCAHPAATPGRAAAASVAPARVASPKGAVAAAPRSEAEPNLPALLAEMEGNYQNGQLSVAIAQLRKVLADIDRRHTPQTRLASELRERLAKLLHWHGEYAECDELMRAAREGFFAEGGRLNPRAARTTAIWAAMLRERLEFEAEERLLVPAVEEWERARGPDFPQVAWFKNELAAMHFSRGDRETAEVLWLEASSGLEKAVAADRWRTSRQELRGALGGVLRNLANLIDRKGELQRAEALYRRSIELTEAAFGPRSVEAAEARARFAVILGRHQKLSEAGEALQSASALYRALLPENHPSLASVHGKLGWFALASGEPAAAAEHFERAARIAEPSLPSSYPIYLNDWAEALERSGDLPGALRMHERALLAAELGLGRLHSATRIAFRRLARAAASIGDVGIALRSYGELGERNEEVLSHALRLGSESQRRAFLSQGILREATDATISLQQERAPSNQKAVELALTAVLRHKGRALEASADTLRLLRAQLSPESAELLSQLERKRSAAAALALRGPAARQSLDDFRQALEARDREARDVEQRLSRSVQLPAASPVTIERVRASLPAGSALLEFVKYRRLTNPSAHDDAHRFADTRYAVYVLPATGAPSAYDLGEARKIDALALALRSELAHRSSAWKRTARSLYDALVRPLQGTLATDAPVFVAPDSSLNLVPFAVLLDEREQPLLAGHPITYLSSGRDRLRSSAGNEASGAVTPALVLAAPDYDASSAPRATRTGLLRNITFPALPGTLAEARSLAATFEGAVVLSGRDASEAALRAVHSPEFLHIAAHAFFFDAVEPRVPRGTRGIELSGSADPEFGADATLEEGTGGPVLSADPLLRAGIALAGANRAGAAPNQDGVVTALEVASLDLTRTDLVTLSACDTALGEVHDGEGVFGLRRALILAGSRAQLLSLWRVADQPTQALMGDYYRRLALGEGRSAALRSVQLDFARKPGRSHPYYWAAFVLSGEDGPLARNVLATESQRSAER